tara:strand:- start:112059 stop:112355 length:297 start_codon:yes stop_codon:yes gene_type:complete
LFAITPQKEFELPTISIFFGIIIKIYYREHNPPHIHAFYQGFEAVFSIKKAQKVTGKFPIKADKIVSEWISKHQVGLMENWNLMQEGKELFRIPGADQ